MVTPHTQYLAAIAAAEDFALRDLIETLHRRIEQQQGFGALPLRECIALKKAATVELDRRDFVRVFGREPRR